MLCFANTKLFRAAAHLTVTGLEHDSRTKEGVYLKLRRAALGQFRFQAVTNFFRRERSEPHCPVAVP